MNLRVALPSGRVGMSGRRAAAGWTVLQFARQLAVDPGASAGAIRLQGCAAGRRQQHSSFGRSYRLRLRAALRAVDDTEAVRGSTGISPGSIRGTRHPVTVGSGTRERAVGICEACRGAVLGKQPSSPQ